MRPHLYSLAGNDTAVLTQSQEHYVKKYLLSILIKNELNRLQRNPYDTLPNLGGPFDLKDEHNNSTTPFLRYLFESIVVPFPFLTGNKGELWPKLQLFLEELAKVDSGHGVEREEMARRRRLKNKGERSIVLMYSMAVKTVEQREQERRDRSLEDGVEGLTLSLDSAPAAAPPAAAAPTSGPLTVIHGVRINVAGIRVIKQRRHVREHEHAEFLVSSTLADGTESTVARRHGQFRRLYIALREEYPQFEFPLPPAKVSTRSGSAGVKAAREKDRLSLRGYLHNVAKVAPEIVTSTIFVSFLTKDAITLTAEEAKDVHVRMALDEHRKEQQAQFAREVTKKVQQLDSHLKQVKQDFLRPGGVSRLFAAFRQYENVNDLPPLYQTVFEWGCMNFASTLYHVFTASDDATLNLTHLKRTHLLMPYRTMWGILKVSNPMAMMKGIMDLFLAQPFGRSSLMQRIISVNIQEEITEYKKDIVQLEAAIGDQGLCDKIHNYVYAPKDVITSIFPDSALYDITELGMVLDVLQTTQIQPLLDPQQINRVRDAKEQLEKDRTEKERLIKAHQDMLIHDLSESDESDSEASSVDEPPKLYRSSSKKSFAKATEKLRSLKQQKQEQKQEQTQSQQQQSQPSQQNLIRLLQQLLVTHLRIRDKERMMGLVFQGVTGEIFKELISIFYEPLVKVYKSANVADSLMDVKDFADELVKIVEQADDNDDGNGGNPSTATLYLNLVKKHLPSFYKFVHAVHKQDDGLFHDLLEWFESILSFMRTGYAHTRTNYKTAEELRFSIDLDRFLKAHVGASGNIEQLRQEAESLKRFYLEVKDKKREEVRQMAGLDRASMGQSDEAAIALALKNDRERVSKELRGFGLQEEDVDELEMINFENHAGLDDDGDDELEGVAALKVPKVPVIDTLREPFVELLQPLFRSARE
ncbi:hypothetical protein BG015_003539 [Linnemannia schmuckeri]|uniref:PX domain-containing protein n=1 Tax=Linnemannia schmuckeri TaxID=64567 RepID=A0A9P5S4N1_9FUNG|nr:hypothetical protein BG015_003539 [Linnemannia schmuckeri]